MTLPPKFQFVGFIAAGGTATVVNYSFFLFLFSLGNQYLLSAAAGYLSGIAVSFALNRWVVYGSKDSIGAQFFRYLIAYAIALIVQLGLLEMLVRWGVSPEWANIFAICVVVVINFFVVRTFVFSNRKDTRQ